MHWTCQENYCIQNEEEYNRQLAIAQSMIDSVIVSKRERGLELMRMLEAMPRVWKENNTSKQAEPIRFIICPKCKTKQQKHMLKL